MSITKARNFFETPGCGWTMAGLLAFVMLISIFGGPTCNSGGTEAPRETVTLATAGTQKVTAEEFRDLAERQIGAMSSSEQGLGPKLEGELYGDVAQGLISRALVQAIADEKGIKISDQELRDEHKRSIETQILQTKMQMIQQGQIKSDASEADFAAAFERMAGRSLASVKEEEEKRFEESLGKPEERAALAYSLIGRKVTESYKPAIKVTDADLKKGFETYTTKRVIAYSSNGTPAEQRAKIEKALSEVKAGTPFERVMERYTDDPLPPGKKSKGEGTLDLPYSALTYDKSLEPILKLKVGEVSGIIFTSSGPAIFKLYKIQSKVPADFEKQKDNLRTGRVNELAFKASSDDLRKRLSSVKFDSPVFKMLVDWRIAANEPEIRADSAKLKARLKEIWTGLREANDPKMDPRVQTLAAYSAFESWHDLATPEEKKEAATDRLAMAAEAVDLSPHIETSQEVVKLAIAQKDGERAAAALRAAIETNGGNSELAETRHKAQTTLKNQLASAGLIDAKQKEELEALLQAWRDGLYDAIKLAAESNADYTEMGESEYKNQLKQVDRYAAAGYISGPKAAELRAELNKWKLGVFEDLKMAIESNVDYTESGQAVFSDLNARIDKYAKAGYISQSQKASLMALQDKWRQEKKKADAEAAKNKPAAPPAGAGPKQPSSGDLLNPGGGTTGG